MECTMAKYSHSSDKYVKYFGRTHFMRWIERVESAEKSRQTIPKNPCFAFHVCCHRHKDRLYSEEDCLLQMSPMISYK
jgi:hypothetical protein